MSKNNVILKMVSVESGLSILDKETCILLGEGQQASLSGQCESQIEGKREEVFSKYGRIQEAL